jgi:hypothetical protein
VLRSRLAIGRVAKIKWFRSPLKAAKMATGGLESSRQE